MAQKLMRPEVLRRGALLGLMALGDLIRRGEPTHIADMDAEVAEVRRDNDNVTRWLYDEGPTAEMFIGRFTEDVYAEYKSWCEKSGERNPCAKEFFTRRINESGYFGKGTLGTATRKVGQKNKRVYVFKTD